MIVESGNDYLGALKGNQSGLLTAVEASFCPEQTFEQINKGHGRIEKRTVSISQNLETIPEFPGLVTLIQVESERQLLKHTMIGVSRETRPDRCFVYRYTKSFCTEDSRLLGCGE